MGGVELGDERVHLLRGVSQPGKARVVVVDHALRDVDAEDGV